MRGGDRPLPGATIRLEQHIGDGTLRGLGPGYWYGGPWFGVTLLYAVKEESNERTH
jgi:hypothetical protein